MEAEEKQNALFDKRLAEEEVWIRQGIKARRTRNEGRVRALKELREQSKARRSQQGKVSMATQDASRSGKVVFEIENLSVRFGMMHRSSKISLHWCSVVTVLVLLVTTVSVKPPSLKPF
jgi:ATPase subunit of ABC transporter with duplicated ATPase domains